MSTSSHFLVSLPASARSPRTPARRPASRNVSVDLGAQRWQAIDEERRRNGLFSLLAVYAVGLSLVVALYQGEDIGVLLSAFLGHAMLMAMRALHGAAREQSVTTRHGLLVVGARARLHPKR